MGKDIPRQIDRRMFLGLLLAGGGCLVAERLGVNASYAESGDTSQGKREFNPVRLNGVDVYGLSESITSIEDITRLADQSDREYLTKSNYNGTISGPEDILRVQKELLDPNKRYLEVAVRRSAYESFEKEKEKTGIDFVGWIKTHVEVTNKCLEEAIPKVDMEVVLRRIVVFDDKCIEGIWNEGAYRSNKGPSLDQVWLSRLWPPVDTDTSWAIADDYRDEKTAAYLYNVRNSNGKVVLEKYYSGGNIQRTFELPGRINAIKGNNPVKLDMGMIHEWGHRLLNLPDEYAQNVSNSGQRFDTFEFATGSFMEPVISPYLSSVLRENIKLKARNLRDPNVLRANHVFNERPENIRIATCFENMDFKSPSVEVTAVRLKENSVYGMKEVPNTPDQKSERGPLNLSSAIFDVAANCWLVRSRDAGGKSREVFLPAAAFNMSEIEGLRSASYDIIFSGYDDPAKKKQEVRFVHKKEVPNIHYRKDDPPYAEMKIPGTEHHLVWYLRS